MKPDMHQHSTASDGSMTPRELVRFAYENGIRVMAITDHDTLDGVDEGEAEAEKINREFAKKINFVKGIEFSTVYNKNGKFFKAHILGYNVDGTNESMKIALADGVKKRAEKLDRRLDYLKAVYGVELPRDEVNKLKSLKTVGKIHLANLMIKHGLGDSIQSIFKNYFDERFPEALIDTKEAISAILDCGGVPVLAHPLGGEGEKHITREEVSMHIDLLKDEGIMGIECYYSRYSDKENQMLCRLANERGLLISGGSDFHGSNKTVIIGTLSSDDTEIDSQKLTVIDEIFKNRKLL